ncbi:MAG: gamma-glutamyl-gamma-aminobutyrate hydrolase family protein, partial [Halanaerobium sp.]
YVNAVYRGGGIPVIIPPFDNKQALNKYLDLVDAVVFSGGNDINPDYYGEKSSFTEKVDLNRDQWETALFKKAYQLDLPILGICR